MTGKLTRRADTTPTEHSQAAPWSESVEIPTGARVLYVSGQVPPVVDAGVDQTVDSGATVQLRGSVSDPDRDIATWEWRQVSGPTIALDQSGALSPRFVAGPVASFLTGVLGAFDRTRSRHLLIALQPGGDAATPRLRALADEWLDVAGLDDRTLLSRLRALELDVLIDLAGHSTANRIGAAYRQSIRLPGSESDSRTTLTWCCGSRRAPAGDASGRRHVAPLQVS